MTTTSRIFFSLVSLVLSLQLHAGLVRVIGIADAHTLIVERGGAAVNVKLAGIAVVDDEGARTLLHWTLISQWVMLEEEAGGGCYVYRSPDALFVNRELVTRGFARATVPALEPPQHVIVTTYLGTLHTSTMAPKAAATVSPKARGTGSGTSPSTPARPTRRRRSPRP